jgi:FliI/YscN family ATPase
MTENILSPYHRRLRSASSLRVSGAVTEVTGLLIASRGPWLPVGGVCQIHPMDRARPMLAEVVGFRDEQTLLMPLGELRGIGPGSKVVALTKEAHLPVDEKLLGRVIDGLGRPMDGKAIVAAHAYPLYAANSNPLEREEIGEPLDVGIRAINALITCGKGQRMAIMAGAGVGKSTLLGMIARNTRADVKIIALIGERGREVEDFVQRALPPQERDRMIVVAATSEAPALVRVRGAFVATTIAEYFRDRGQDVLLLMDSLSRFAMAQREAGLTAGEPPTTKGYPPSVFALLPRLIERAGNWKGKGSITGLYTVLLEGDDPHEPIADAVRSMTDGHIQMSRRLAEQAHYPAIDVLSSVSRVRPRVTSKGQQALVNETMRLLAAYRDAEDLIQIGAYARGKNPDVDRAVELLPRIREFLRQDESTDAKLDTSLRSLAEIFAA